ncbi:MAG: hypothetical protein V8R00_00395 [Coprococcus catus]
MKDILRVKNLNKSYKNFSLTDVSFFFWFTGVTRHAARASYLPDAITSATIEDIMLANLGGCGK